MVNVEIQNLKVMEENREVSFSETDVYRESQLALFNRPIKIFATFSGHEEFFNNEADRAAVLGGYHTLKDNSSLQDFVDNVISTCEAKGKKISELNISAHGSGLSMRLGDRSYSIDDQDTIEQFARLRPYVEGGVIRLDSCNVADDPSAHVALQRLANATGATIEVSPDIQTADRWIFDLEGEVHRYVPAPTDLS